MTSTPKPSPYADLVNQRHGHIRPASSSNFSGGGQVDSPVIRSTYQVGDPDPFYPLPGGERVCLADYDEYCCTRARGHDGPHVAGASTAPVRTIVAVWE